MTAADAHNSSFDRNRADPDDQSAIHGRDVVCEVYDELRRLARHHLSGERVNHTLQPTALVHEAYLRLLEQSQVPWKSRQQFIALASTAIRHILVDYARNKKAAKRTPAGHAALPPPDGHNAEAEVIWREDLAALDEALNRLAELNPRSARVVELRFFGGLTINETAELLEVSPASIERDWQFARAWLRTELAPNEWVDQ